MAAEPAQPTQPRARPIERRTGYRKVSKIVVITGTHGDGTAGNLGDPTYAGSASVANFAKEDIATINTLSKGKSVTVTFKDVSKYTSDDKSVREKKRFEVLTMVTEEVGNNATVVLGWCWSACWGALKNHGVKTDCTNP